MVGDFGSGDTFDFTSAKTGKVVKGKQGFGNALGQAFGGGDEPFQADISQNLAQLSALRGQIQNQPQLPQMPTQDIDTISNVTNPLLNQMIQHFGVGPETADGELGQLLKERGF